MTFTFSKNSNYERESLPYYLKKIFPPIIWIFTEGEGEGDGIESRLPFKIFSTLQSFCLNLHNPFFWCNYWWHPSPFFLRPYFFFISAFIRCQWVPSIIVSRGKLLGHFPEILLEITPKRWLEISSCHLKQVSIYGTQCWWFT